MTLSCNIKKFKLAYQLFVKILEKLSNIEQNKSTNSCSLNEGKKMHNLCFEKKKKKKISLEEKCTICSPKSTTMLFARMPFA